MEEAIASAGGVQGYFITSLAMAVIAVRGSYFFYPHYNLFSCVFNKLYLKCPVQGKIMIMTSLKRQKIWFMGRRVNLFLPSKVFPKK